MDLFHKTLHCCTSLVRQHSGGTSDPNRPAVSKTLRFSLIHSEPGLFQCCQAHFWQQEWHFRGVLCPAPWRQRLGFEKRKKGHLKVDSWVWWIGVCMRVHVCACRKYPLCREQVENAFDNKLLNCTDYHRITSCRLHFCFGKTFWLSIYIVATNIYIKTLLQWTVIWL